jgi:O-antigen biosynthesis protein
LLYDAEALFHRRMTKELDFLTDPFERAQAAAAADEMRDLEMRILKRADLVVCLSDDEASVAREVKDGSKVVTKIPFLGGIRWTERPFEERQEILLVASWMAGPRSPNADGLTWFLAKVFPLIQARIPWVQLRITGQAPPDSLTALARYGVTFEGLVADLSSLYESARCVIVPLRFGSGVKIKTIEALQFGVPVVATGVGAEGIDLHDSGAVAIHDGPESFSKAVIQLLVDGTEWQAQRDRIKTLHEIWDKADAQRPSWTEILERVQEARVDPSTTLRRERAHAG